MNINDIQIPILQAPIDTSTDLAAAVSNAGGMGSVQGTWKNPDEAAVLVDKVLGKTKNPFFVNFVRTFAPKSLDAVIEACGQGAKGVMLGTRFVATKESSAHQLYKDALIRSHSLDTVYTICFAGGWAQAPHRVLRNKTFTDWEAAGCLPKGR